MLAEVFFNNELFVLQIIIGNDTEPNIFPSQFVGQGFKPVPAILRIIYLCSLHVYLKGCIYRAAIGADRILVNCFIQWPLVVPSVLQKNFGFPPHGLTGCCKRYVVPFLSKCKWCVFSQRHSHIYICFTFILH